MYFRSEKVDFMLRFVLIININFRSSVLFSPISKIVELTDLDLEQINKWK